MRLALVSCVDLPVWEVDDRPLVAAFEARGVEVHRPAWDDPAVRWSGFDGALIRTTWDYMERQEAFVAWAEAAELRTVLLHGAAIVRWNTRKTYLRELEALGVPLAPTVWLERGATVDVAAVLAERGWTRAFCKPVVGATARHTLRFQAEEARAAQAFLEARLAEEAMLVQPYLASVEHEGELSVVVIDGQATHAVRKVPVTGDYRVQDDFGATDMPIPLPPDLAALADVALATARRRLDLREPFLYARVDALRGPDGLVLNELEVVEPSLFFRHGPHAAQRLADATLRRVAEARG